MPHQAVITLRKTTTKLRIVYDASVRSNKAFISLNEALYQGPVNLPLLAGTQLRVKYTTDIVIADIEKAYLQISLREQDRNVTRFLWLKNWRKGVILDNIQVYRFARVAFEAISSPFLLGAVIRHLMDSSISNDSDSKNLRKGIQ